MLFRRMVQRNRDGSYQVRLGDVEREVVVGICGELRELLTADPGAPVVWRLFPDAYTDDDEQERFYQQMNRSDLVASRLAALDVVEQTAGASTLSREELEQWMTALNAVRLTLGTALEVTEEPIEIEPDDPNIGLWAAYQVLSELLGSIVRALAER